MIHTHSPNLLVIINWLSVRISRFLTPSLIAVSTASHAAYKKVTIIKYSCSDHSTRDTNVKIRGEINPRLSQCLLAKTD